ncbi:MAG: spherulation-specific family 4 protein [Nitrososphaerales archaeon]
MKKVLRYFMLIVFAGIIILFFSSYSKWFYPELLQSNVAKKDEVVLQENSIHEKINLQETFSADVYDTNQMFIPNNSTDLNENMQMIVVPYFVPEAPDWQVLYNEADKNPGIIKYAIINPCSGPCGDSLSPEWQKIISELKKRNIKTLGYIFDTAQSIENIDYYMKAPVFTDGIFFDNEGSVDTVERFRQYADHVHSLEGIVYINPGFNYPHVIKYLNEGLADVANVYEFESSNSHHIEIDKMLQPRQLSVILGNVYDISEMKKMLSETSDAGIGTVYVYSDSYHELPPFFSELVKEITLTKVQSGLLQTP